MLRAVPLTAADVEQIIRDADALLEGHFVLASGKHSGQYLEKFRVFERPRLTERLAAGIVERVRDQRIDAVAGPTTGGVILAHEVARQLGARALYAERDEPARSDLRSSGAPAPHKGPYPRGPGSGRSGRVLRRGQALRTGERVLVVDDILTSGGSVRETVAAVRAAGGEVVRVAVLVDRSGGFDLGVPLTALWTIRMADFEPADCPLCARGLPAEKPGTTPTLAQHR